MKKIVLLISILVISCKTTKTRSSYYTPIHKYRIEYSVGNESRVDFTNNYKITKDGCIQYFDTAGNQSLRCGIFSTVKLK